MTTFILICIILFAVAAIALIAMTILFRPGRMDRPCKRVHFDKSSLQILKK